MKNSLSDKKLIAILEHPTLTPTEKNHQACALIREVKSNSHCKHEIKGLYWAVCRYGTVEQLHLLVHDFQGLYYGWTLGSFMVRVLALYNRIDLILYLSGKIEVDGCTFNPHRHHVFYSYKAAISEVAMIFFRYNYVTSILSLLRHGVHMFDVTYDTINSFTSHKYHFHSLEDYYRHIQNRLESYPAFDWDAFFALEPNEDYFASTFLPLMNIPYIHKRFNQWLDTVRRPQQRATLDNILHSHVARDVIQYDVCGYV